MRLLNPWALVGLVAVAAPVVAHLLARRPARRQPFPTLRFLPASTPRPVSRERLTDLGLLALRCLIVAGAAFALAEPVWVSDERARDLGRQIARAIIVDTSASMRRVSPGVVAGTGAVGGAGAGAGEPVAPGGAGAIGSQAPARQPPSGPAAIDRARARAQELADTATIARIVETDAPATLVAGAQAWLAAQPMRRELVIVSDFQAGTIGRLDLVDLQTDTGVRLETVTVAGPAAENSQTPPTLASTDGRDPRWPALLAGDADRALADAARAAAIATGAPEQTGAIAVLFPAHPGRADLLRAARPLRAAETFSIYERVIRDPLVTEAIARQGRRAADMLSAVEATVDGEAVTVIVFAALPTPTEAAAVVRAASIAASPAWIPESERTAEVLAAAEREALQRETPESATGRPPDASHARWVWMAVLALLVTEQLLRRNQRAAVSEEASHARVA